MKFPFSANCRKIFFAFAPMPVLYRCPAGYDEDRTGILLELKALRAVNVPVDILSKSNGLAYSIVTGRVRAPTYPYDVRSVTEKTLTFVHLPHIMTFE